MTFDKTPLYRLYTDERGNEIWIKRDDLLPFCFGGNKARIAYELFEDMRARGMDYMLAYGNARSNLCRTLSNLCASQGIGCTVLSPADDDGSRVKSYNQMISTAFGAEVIPCLKTDVASAVDAAMDAIKARGKKPYYIYGDRTGGGNLQTPVRAYIKVWKEIEEQQAALGTAFDEVFLATGTGMTQAGLICGKALYGGRTEITGISVARDEVNGKTHIARYVRSILREQAIPEISFTDRYALGYGVYCTEMLDCARDALRRFGVPLDMTYTGKGFFGMLGELERRGMRGKRLLFLHTGGTPLFFDKADEILG